jgi:protein PhnA
MFSKKTELAEFLSTYLSDCDPDENAEVAAVSAFLSSAGAKSAPILVGQLRELESSGDLDLLALCTASNRWFAEEVEARSWLGTLRVSLEKGFDSGASDRGAFVVKDCNGTRLEEGDSVVVIKDLKVKGGSSDLKRGTVVRRIHLVGDPEVIECRVEGSTLVLKTCFLRKS